MIMNSSGLRLLTRHSQDLKILFQQCQRENHRICASKMFMGLEKLPPDSKISSTSHRLLLYNNLIYQSHPGAFHYLPPLQKAFEKLVSIIDDQMQAIGGQKVSLSSITPAKLWKASDRWESSRSELFVLKDRHNVEYCLGPTHEEAITKLVGQLNQSPKMLPIKLYQITKKFRDERRPANGLLRGREFEMKDLYTFDRNIKAAEETYRSVCQAYHNIFNILGLKYIKVAADTGNIGGSMSHEFHIPAPVGQDTLHVCPSCNLGINSELKGNWDEMKCEECDTTPETKSGIEIGHAFLLGTKYSSVFKAIYKNRYDTPELTQMGCYGIGVSRLLAAAVEVLAVEDDIRWPLAIAPYIVSIIPHKSQGVEGEEAYDHLQTLPGLRNQVVLDDRFERHSIPKMIFFAKRIGIPYIVVFQKQGTTYEFIDVGLDKVEIFTDKTSLYDRLTNIGQTVQKLKPL
ncbi:unnamed protein product [Owenia fusiformis]|uniref:Probable proline--tRNA ligase, mitochondrial n=1 Tax=Owenia fusiformis TaxID=6347 RepID=A0A8S4N2M9_OWEFU|nr:unnamed protein product [Owenia fusiformis]